MALGLIKMFGGATAPSGWLFCDGRSLSATDYAALYAVVGNSFGGDSENFNLPDMRGRVAVGVGQGSGLTDRGMGDVFGSEEVVLVNANLPLHTHSVTGRVRANNTLGNLGTAQGNFFAGNQNAEPYRGTASADSYMNNATLELSMDDAGDSDGHDNLQPSICVHFIIKVIE